jgi:hypothetical protein
MESMVIHAVNPESAQGFCAALSEFRARLIEAEDGGYQVEVPLVGGDQAIIAVLTTLEAHVRERDDGPAYLDVGGHEYTLNSPDAP